MSHETTQLDMLVMETGNSVTLLKECCTAFIAAAVAEQINAGRAS